MMKKNHKIMVPYSHLTPPSDSQYKFKFIKPSAIHIVGSYALKTVIKTKTQFNVDVAVEMPSVRIYAHYNLLLLLICIKNLIYLYYFFFLLVYLSRKRSYESSLFL